MQFVLKFDQLGDIPHIGDHQRDLFGLIVDNRATCHQYFFATPELLEDGDRALF